MNIELKNYFELDSNKNIIGLQNDVEIVDDGIIKPNAKGLKEHESVDWNNFIISFRNKICDELVRILLPILQRSGYLSNAFYHLSLSLDLIDQYKSDSDVNIKYALSKCQVLPTNWIRNNLKYLDSIQIQLRQVLDEDILEKLAPDLNADIISEKQQLSRDWILNNLVSLNIRYIVYFQDCVDEEFIEQLLKIYKDWSKIPWNEIVESIQLSEQFIERHFKYLVKSELTKHQYLPIKLIERHITEFTKESLNILLDNPIYKNREKRLIRKLTSTTTK